MKSIMSETECEKHGSITVIYDPCQRDVWPSLERSQQRSREIIRASFRAPVNENTALQLILVRGTDSRIKSLLEQLKSRKGVRSVNLTVISAT
jgi:metal-responsive CopG/Arc/MetJ family transcriptional regulator